MPRLVLIHHSSHGIDWLIMGFNVRKIWLGYDACHNGGLLINAPPTWGSLKCAGILTSGCFRFSPPSEKCLPRPGTEPPFLGSAAQRLNHWATLRWVVVELCGQCNYHISLRNTTLAHKKIADKLQGKARSEIHLAAGRLPCRLGFVQW